MWFPPMMWFRRRRTSQSGHGVGSRRCSGRTPMTMRPVFSRARRYWRESKKKERSAGGGHEPLLAPGRLRPGPLLDAAEPLHQPLPGVLGLGRQALERLQLPGPQDDRDQDAVVVDLEVVDPGVGDD